jgi:hypothetical protein
MSKVNSILGRLLIALALLLPIAASAAAQPRDANSNAMVYNGAYTKTELVHKLQQGDGKGGHDASELQRQFERFGISQQTILSSQTVDGNVTRTGKVMVGDKTVATGAVSYGRQNLPGSHRSGDLFARSTSISFQQSQLPAFVIMKDGRFQSAIIKSCGNLVTATPVAAVKSKTVKAAPVKVIQTQTQTITKSAPAPTPPPPIPLPQTGAGIAGLIGGSGIITAAWYWHRSRRALLQAQARINAV